MDRRRKFERPPPEAKYQRHRLQTHSSVVFPSETQITLHTATYVEIFDRNAIIVIERGMGSDQIRIVTQNYRGLRGRRLFGPTTTTALEIARGFGVVFNHMRNHHKRT